MLVVSKKRRCYETNKHLLKQGKIFRIKDKEPSEEGWKRLNDRKELVGCSQTTARERGGLKH